MFGTEVEIKEKPDLKLWARGSTMHTDRQFRILKAEHTPN